MREHITRTYCILLPFHSRLIVSFVAFIVSLIHCNTGTSCGIVARVSGGIVNIFSIEFSW